MIAQDRDVGKLPYRQREHLAAAENRVAGEQHYWLCKPGLAPGLNAPGPQPRERIPARTHLRSPVERHSRAVTKSIDDGDRSVVFAARVVADIDDEPLQIVEVARDLVQSGCQLSLLDALQLEDSHIANGL